MSENTKILNNLLLNNTQNIAVILFYFINYEKVDI